MKPRTALPISFLVASVMLSAQFAVAQEEKQQSPHEEIQKLLVERRDTLRELFATVEKNYRSGKATFADMADAHDRLLGAELEVAATKEQRVKLREKQVAIMRELEKTMKERQAAGVITTDKVLLTTAARQQAEIDLLREQANHE